MVAGQRPISGVGWPDRSVEQRPSGSRTAAGVAAEQRRRVVEQRLEWWQNSGQVITEQRRKWGRTTDGSRMDKPKEWPKEGQTAEHQMGTETADGQADKEGT